MAKRRRGKTLSQVHPIVTNKSTAPKVHDHRGQPPSPDCKAWRICSPEYAEGYKRFEKLYNERKYCARVVSGTIELDPVIATDDI